jgi:hypothetical protein
MEAEKESKRSYLQEKLEQAVDEEITDKINSTIYWFVCEHENCEFQTDDYLRAYFHRAKTVPEHSILIKEMSINRLMSIINHEIPKPRI